LLRDALRRWIDRPLTALFFGAAALVAGSAADAQSTALVLKRFAGIGGANPQSALFIGRTGALFGTAAAGGSFSSGLVFQLTPPAIGKTGWTLTHLYDFCVTTGCVGGTLPLAGLTPDGAGGFFGTTSSGGAHGNGTVFRLRRPAAGATRWSLTPLYDFCAEKLCRDGSAPSAPVLRDPRNVLYGTAFGGGAHSDGAVFALTPPAAGQAEWRYAVIHDFAFHDGAGPLGSLVLGSAGKLYGTTSEAGANGHGTAFELTPPATGSSQWSFRVIYQFCAQEFCADGADPYSGPLRGQGGTLYGTTMNGGSGNWGTVYALLPPDYGAERVLHSFAFSDGAAPVGGLIRDSAGALYGTTSLDGASGYGTVFKLASATGRDWTETVLHDFAGPDGDEPVATLALGSGGALYGTTEFGGSVNNDGIVFEIKP
jgi:uncharacterized repeat protein (TIGR03803 family)